MKIGMIILEVYIASVIVSYFFIKNSYEMVPESHRDVVRPSGEDLISLFIPIFNLWYSILILLGSLSNYKFDKDFYNRFFRIKK